MINKMINKVIPLKFPLISLGKTQKSSIVTTKQQAIIKNRGARAIISLSLAIFNYILLFLENKNIFFFLKYILNNNKKNLHHFYLPYVKSAIIHFALNITTLALHK